MSSTMSLIVFDEIPTTEDLLFAWRDASRAAELACRLAGVGDTAAATTEHDAAAASEVASLVESTAQAATEAAAIARGTGDRMKRAAEAARIRGKQDAAAVVAAAADAETSTRDGYHGAEHEPRLGRDGDKP